MRRLLILLVIISSPSITIADEFNQEAKLILKVAPKFPTKPYHTENLEGWVKLQFDVTELGVVTNIIVLESSPSRVFDLSAKKALAKWRYKPKVVNTKPVISKGLMETIEFKLTE
jgi:protein TonB